jgi:hypothetical protein
MVHAYGPQAMIAGARGAVAQSDVALLSSIAMMKPKRPVDYSRLLAEVNRRASKQRPFGKLISEACVTTYIPPTGEPFQHQKHFWGLARATNEKVVPMTLFGIDLTEWSQIMMDNFRTLIDPNAAVREEAEKRVDRLMLKANQRAVRP